MRITKIVIGICTGILVLIGIYLRIAGISVSGGYVR
jgi:hypothetical protein